MEYPTQSEWEEALRLADDLIAKDNEYFSLVEKIPKAPPSTGMAAITGRDFNDVLELAGIEQEYVQRTKAWRQELDQAALDRKEALGKLAHFWVWRNVTVVLSDTRRITLDSNTKPCMVTIGKGHFVTTSKGRFVTTT